MIRPVDTPVGQGYGANPTSVLPATHWVIKQFGNYQPDGHAGEDYPCNIGTPVRAVTAGRVVHVGYYGGTYADNPYWIAPNFAGYCYVIDHGAFIGIYAHGQDGATRVRVGQQVSEAQVIGLSGNTGGSTGPHLHFEILPDGFVVNSYMYGRIDPATIFAGGGLAAQGTTITPAQEDDVSAQDVLSWPIERTDGQKSTVAVELAKIGPDQQATQKAIRELNATLQALPAKIAEATMRHPVTLATGQPSDLLTEIAALRPDVWAAIKAISTAQITGSSTVDVDAVAADIRKKLAEQIGGTK